MDKTILKKIGIALGAVALFLALSYGFVPKVLQGQIVDQSDISGYIGMSREMTEWNKTHPDDPTYWTDSMFGGMPTTAISTRNSGDLTQVLYDFLLTGKRPATYLFIALLGAFLLLLALGIDWKIALGGAVAIAFCSYNFQIIQVGHNTKMQAIAFMPWALAAMVFTYKAALEGPSDNRHSLKEYLPQTVLGAVLFALAVSMQIKANHQQVTYYLALIILIYALVLLVDILWKQREKFTRFLVASLLLLVIGGIGIATNVNKLLPLYKYTPYTMRGGSELSGGRAAGENKGLDLEYATAWSYGWEELPNMMIPNFNGGASAGAVNPDKSETIALLRRAGQGNLKETAKHLPMYWGPQPFTAGPMYMGAITIFLFILGLCLYKGRDKWWLLIATILAILLAVGSHFMAFTKLCFVILPLYNKFRTVSMALVILQVTLPILGFLVLDRIVKGDYTKKEFMKGGLTAFALTGGVCLILALVPSLAGSFTGAVDAGQPDVLVDAFIADRKMLLRQDALYSFVFISLAFLLLLWAFSPKGQTEHSKAFAGAGRRTIAGVTICLLVLINMFAVGKRYLNSDHFTTPKNFTRQFTERPVDKKIKEDPSTSYRVLDLTVNVFNSSVPSYHHKSIGGYSPAKLQRYQDLIDRYLSGEINSIYKALQGAVTIEDAKAALPSTPILNALNDKYIIVGGENPPIVNENALGAAWFVSSVIEAASPDEEIALIGSTDLASTAVVGADFTPAAFSIEDSGDEDSIELVSYAPNELRYRYCSTSERLAVFSEIYYPGWKIISFDGETPSEDIPVIRTDWTLRGAILPAGNHEFAMRFDPDSYRVGASVSKASSIALIILTLIAVCGMAVPKKKN